jgi:hypothetical protein
MYHILINKEKKPDWLNDQNKKCNQYFINRIKKSFYFYFYFIIYLVEKTEKI